jgi:hypothetical protein
MSYEAGLCFSGGYQGEDGKTVQDHDGREIKEADLASFELLGEKIAD